MLVQCLTGIVHAYICAPNLQRVARSCYLESLLNHGIQAGRRKEHRQRGRDLIIRGMTELDGQGTASTSHQVASHPTEETDPWLADSSVHGPRQGSTHVVGRIGLQHRFGPTFAHVAGRRYLHGASRILLNYHVVLQPMPRRECHEQHPRHPLHSRY